nr:MAG TPA: hypothetical protein [Caudoviricetes sp.]
MTSDLVARNRTQPAAGRRAASAARTSLMGGAGAHHAGGVGSGALLSVC